MALRILWIDFQQQEAQAYLQYLKDHLKIELECSDCSIEEYEKKISAAVPELVFIDIDQISLSLREMAGKIKACSESVGIVWVSDDPDRAVEAFDLEIDDYIVRPFQYERILKPIFRRVKQKSNFLSEVISVWETDRFVVLRPEQIIYCYTAEGKTAIKGKNGEYFSLNTLASFEQKLSKYCFFRTHKSFLVNQNYIKAIIPWFNHTYHLMMDFYEHDEVPVSRTYLKEFKQQMGIE